MASVRGSLIRKSVPLPTSDLISTLPPRRSRLVLTTSMPTPRPEMSVTFSAVDRPGRKMRATLSWSDMPRSFSAVISPLARADSATPARVDALAVIGDFDHHLAGFMPRLNADRARPLLPGANPLLGRLDAVVDRVADHVGQGIRQAFDQAPVQRHVFSLDVELDLFVQRIGHVAHHPGKLAEHVADGLEPGPHDGVLEIGGHLVEALVGDGERLEIVLGDGRTQLVAAQHQFSGQVHQGLEQSHVDPEGVIP